MDLIRSGMVSYAAASPVINMLTANAYCYPDVLNFRYIMDLADALALSVIIINLVFVFKVVHASLIALKMPTEHVSVILDTLFTIPLAQNAHKDSYLILLQTDASTYADKTLYIIPMLAAVFALVDTVL